LREEDDYIARPKPDGYRSHHLMFNFRDRRNAGIHDGRRIEVQLRTRLQHSWATAVEAVGLFRGEDLKGNQGNPKWLRLFTLMSAEFAERA
jgi:Region found in RelA / SpoT proteins